MNTPILAALSSEHQLAAIVVVALALCLIVWLLRNRITGLSIGKGKLDIKAKEPGSPGSGIEADRLQSGGRIDVDSHTGNPIKVSDLTAKSDIRIAQGSQNPKS
jgi:hypothetical protein